MEQIIIKCNYNSETFYRLRNDIDCLKDTNIDFKVNLAAREIIFPLLNKSVIYAPADAFKTYIGRRNIIDSNNYSIKEIIESSDK